MNTPKDPQKTTPIICKCGYRLSDNLTVQVRGAQDPTYIRIRLACPAPGCTNICEAIIKAE
jgi:hypothetical protein